MASIAGVNRLLEAGADPNETVHYWGKSVLEVAAGNGHLIVSQKLLEKSARPDYCSSQSEASTPLITATAAGHVEISKALLQAGADVSITKEYGKKSAIEAAAGISSMTLAELFLQTFAATIAEFDPDELHAAVSQGRQEDSKRLVALSESVSSARESIDAALIAAGGAGDMAILQRLLDAGAERWRIIR
ncbi:unnamed protein product [Discula destructiva]